MRPDDQTRVQHMLDATRSVARFIAGRQKADLESDEMLRFALLRAIEILGEAASKISPEARQAMPGIPWREVVGMRNWRGWGSRWNS